MYSFLLKIYNKINFKNIIENIIICIALFIVFKEVILPFVNEYIYKNNKEIINYDFKLNEKEIINKELNADGKDIIIILDNFNSKHDWHGNDVSDKLKSYFKRSLKKEIDIKLINLSFNEKENIQYIDIINYNQNRAFRYQKINNESYQLETYIKQIRELNPNSKIILSISWSIPKTNNKIIELSKKYDYKIVQAYYNPYKYEYIYKIPFNIFYFYFDMDYTNTILVSTQNTKPLWYLNQISLDDIKHDKELEDNVDWSTSYLTPILGYEYYLNKNSNIINKDNIIK